MNARKKKIAAFVGRLKMEDQLLKNFKKRAPNVFATTQTYICVGPKQQH